MIKFLYLLYDILVPRFITEDVALRYLGVETLDEYGECSAYEIECSMDDVEPGEKFDATAEVDSFTWLGFGYAYRIRNVRDWASEVSRG